jgi:hypothetical protein
MRSDGAARASNYGQRVGDDPGGDAGLSVTESDAGSSLRDLGPHFSLPSTEAVG